MKGRKDPGKPVPNTALLTVVAYPKGRQGILHCRAHGLNVYENTDRGRVGWGGVGCSKIQRAAHIQLLR